MNKKDSKQGFTIIEVVLVLAIAGLIFLMVFVALPALQRSQRDTARKQDNSSIAAAVTTFESNNRGVLPNSDQIKSYATNLSDNTTSISVSTNQKAQNVMPSDGVAQVTWATTCGTVSTTDAELLNGTTRQFTVVTKLESGNGSYYCLQS
jgi:prepilin-type N-terminal cleavage/methylation domain-containing protein